MRTLRVLIADDDDLFRESLEQLVSLEPNATVVGVARNGLEAVERTARLFPDLVLMDWRMPVMDGIEATRIIKASPLPPFVVICTADSQLIAGRGELAHGADAILSKTEVTDEILDLLTRLLRPSSSVAVEAACRRHLTMHG